jgi:DNA-binding XRE family transcriptional regulator
LLAFANAHCCVYLLSVTEPRITTMTGPRSLRRDLGRRLAAARRAAGYTQQRLAAATGYSRSTVSNAEIGHPDVAQVFWVRCDEILNSGRTFGLAFEQVRAAERDHAAESAKAADGSQAGPAGRAAAGLAGGTAEALAGYLDLGWPAVARDDIVELVTGDVLDALELPRAAGLLAASLWLYSGGRPDDARRLPELPHPARSMAVITAGDRCFVLAAAGGCPWTGQQPAPDGGPDDDPDGRVIRWHAGGARIPAPPSALAAGGQVAWAHLPSSPVQLAPPVALLGLLATATAGACGGPAGLTLPGGIRVLPPPSAPAAQ